MFFFDRTIKWFQTAGQISEPPKPNPRQMAFYTGMQCEELVEKLAAVGIPCEQLSSIADQLKSGRHDAAFQLLSPAQQLELLDGDMDMLWVTVGSVAAHAADGSGAWNEVARANWDKFPDGVVTRHPDTGKVLKPEGWRAPDLRPFLYGATK